MSDDRIEAETWDVLRKRHSNKWRHYPDDVIPMFVAEMDYPLAEPITRMLREFVDAGDLGYLGPIPELAPAFVGFAERRWGWTPDTTHSRLAGDVGIATVEYLRANDVHDVIITSPVYAGFWGWLSELAINIVDVPLADGWTLDLAGIERQFEAGVKHLLLCNPHNPMGKVFTRAELTALAELADKHGAVVIADEIHAPLTYPGIEFVPYLSLGPAAERTGVLVTSTSKSWNLAGLKAAFILVCEPLAQTMAKLPMALTWRTSILGAFSMATAYAECETWLDSTLDTLAIARDHLASELERLLPGARLEAIPEAGYLAWVDVSGLELGDAPWDRMIGEARVAFVPGTSLGSQYTQHVRINFATSPAIITEALERVAAIV